MENIVEDWYSMDDKHITSYLKRLSDQQERILIQQDQIVSHLTLLTKKIEMIESKLNTCLEEKETDKVDTKKVAHALHELTIIKEREINVLLREHIPFPFQHPSPQFRRSFLPFSSPKKQTL